MLYQQLEGPSEEKELIESLINDYESCIEGCNAKEHPQKFKELCVKFCSLEKFINTMFYLG